MKAKQSEWGQRPSQGKQVELPAHQAFAGDRRMEDDEGLHLSSIVAASAMPDPKDSVCSWDMCSRVA
jgi:hypothetical protein